MCLTEVRHQRVIRRPKRLTSAQANRVLDEANVSLEKRKQSIDMMAAGLLLQSYLDSLGAA